MSASGEEPPPRKPAAAPRGGARGRTLLLARHGETAWNSEGRWQGHTDIALSERGREQARALAARLRRLDLAVGRIRTSDLARARETAEIVAAALAVTDLVIDPRLRERGFGVFEGLTREECGRRFPELWASYEQDRKILPPGGEPHDGVIARLGEALRSACAPSAVANQVSAEVAAELVTPAPPDDGAVLIIGHGGALRVFLSSVFARPFPPIANAGLLRLRVEGDHLSDVEDLGSE